MESGRRVSHYRVIAPIGAGGMGVVYLAEDEHLRRRVALKFLPPALALDDAARRRFEREAQAAGSLDHPNIATIYEIADAGGQAFIAMAYYEGETLRARMARGLLPLGEVLAIAEQVASALSAAHAAGVAHRDLKPENIIITKSGEVKLLDFGLAKLLSGETQTASRVTQAGSAVGTAAYMSPEQIRGSDVDERSDVWSFGVMLYEVVGGRRPFDGPTDSAVLDAILTATPRLVQELRSAIPARLARLIERALVKDAAQRDLSAATMVEEFRIMRAEGGDASTAHAVMRTPRATWRWSPLLAALVISVLILGAVAARLLARSNEARWARQEALPEIERLTEQEHSEHFVGAYDLAVRAQHAIGDDPSLARLWRLISRSVSIATDPPGATVSYREYGDTTGPWRPIGQTPLDEVRLPVGFLQLHIEKDGYLPVDDTTGTTQIMGVTNSKSYRLDPTGSAPAGMVRASTSGSGFAPRIPGAAALPEIDLPDFWIDRFEVTNREFKRFVDAGGYSEQKYWRIPIRDEGRTLSWNEALTRFHDATGRPGPANWELGSYAADQDDFPVTGVSFYEAAAYAEYAGKELPTIYHWTDVASQGSSPDVAPRSNFSGRGPARVGSLHDVSRFGTYDMAGNAKEWVWNAADNDKRYIMGGGWDEPEYQFTVPDARPALQRLNTFGFRCIKAVSPTTPLPEAARSVVTFPSRDYSRERPVSDEVFRAYRAVYAYDKGNLAPTVESHIDGNDWVREKIAFNAAYGGERMAAWLYLPKHGKAPFQTVVWFPTSGALNSRSSASGVGLRYFDFIIKSGRAVIVPIFKSTFERGDGLTSDVPNSTSLWRDHVIDWSKDIGRTIDYLETRSDIASDKLAYAGLSWGAAMAAIMPAVEPRLRAVIAIIGGFNMQPVAPEVSAVNFAPRVTVPVLMLNGRYDYFYPVKVSQEPMFKFLGSPPNQKRRVVYDTGHNIPRPEMVKETIDWLDKYLGPVK